MRVLIVDDNPDILTILSASLDAMGSYELTTALSGHEALELVSAAPEPFDMFMLDIQMPKMTGIELCRNIKSKPEYRFTPVLMITAMTEKQYVDQAFAVGATDYINKPFDPYELKHRVGLAERSAFQERQLMEDAQTIAIASSEALTRNPFTLSDAIPIDDVNGVMRVYAFESYLKHLNLIQFKKTQLVVVSVTNIEEIHARCTGREFADQIADIAESISGALVGVTPFITYFGQGIYCVAIDTAHFRGENSLISGIEDAIYTLGMSYRNRDPVVVQVEISEVAMPSLFSPKSPSSFVDSFMQHMKAVPTAANSIV